MSFNAVNPMPISTKKYICMVMDVFMYDYRVVT